MAKITAMQEQSHMWELLPDASHLRETLPVRLSMDSCLLSACICLMYSAETSWGTLKCPDLIRAARTSFARWEEKLK
nr:hypothetical protein [Akkermansia muciniphila]